LGKEYLISIQNPNVSIVFNHRQIPLDAQSSNFFKHIMQSFPEEQFTDGGAVPSKSLNVHGFHKALFENMVEAHNDPDE